jgi:hypothetical protein
VKTNLHHRPEESPDETKKAIETFLAGSREPVLLEPGEEQFALTSGQYVIELSAGRIVMQAWNRDANLSRRILGIKESRTGVLVLSTQRFGKLPGTLQLLDLARPKAQIAAKRGSRLTYREQFHRSLTRQFPSWDISHLSTEPNLQYTLSSVFPRALLKKGSAGWAAIGAAPDRDDGTEILSFGLIWLDYLRRQHPKIQIAGLILFIPAGQEKTTCHRILCLDPAVAKFTIYVHSADGIEQKIDWKDYGNLETRLQPRRPEVQDQPEWIDALSNIPGLQMVEAGDGSLSYRVRGLEIAHKSGGVLTMGLETKRVAGASNLPEIQALAREVARMRSPGAADRRNSIYLRYPELWLESEVRSAVGEIDAGIRSSPIYGQVPAFAAGERGIIDLLAADTDGRLAVLELKASEDIHLPLQALDYWIRVKWHLERGEFGMNGYFPGVQLVSRPPRILLVAPSLEFHPSIETILRYFSPAIEVTRIGLNMDWRQQLRVMFQMQGWQSPA